LTCIVKYHKTDAHYNEEYKIWTKNKIINLCLTASFPNTLNPNHQLRPLKKVKGQRKGLSLSSRKGYNPNWKILSIILKGKYKRKAHLANEMVKIQKAFQIKKDGLSVKNHWANILGPPDIKPK